MTVPARTCGCGCGASIDHLRPDARYATDACRTKAWKARRGYAEQRAPQASPNGNARRMAQARQAGPVAADKRIQFSRAVQAVTRLLIDVGWTPEDAAADADVAMTDALPSSRRTRQTRKER